MNIKADRSRGFGIGLLVLIGVFCSHAEPVAFEDLLPLSISSGEQVDFQSIAPSTMIEAEEVPVRVNLPKTSRLAPGRHTLIYSAVSFEGETITKVTTLDVDHAGAQASVPGISGLSDFSYYQGKQINLRQYLTTTNALGQPVNSRISIERFEHLAPGTHDVWVTAVDAAGQSFSMKAVADVIAMEQKYRAAELALLGPKLGEKYYSGQYSTEFTPNIVFGYGESEPVLFGSVNADMSYPTLGYDTHTDVRVEPLLARFLLAFRELRHHRYLWLDQQYITICLMIYVEDFWVAENGDRARKNRGFPGIKVPVSVFRRADYETVILESLQGLADMPLNMFQRPFQQWRENWYNYENPDSGIELLFIQDLEKPFKWLLKDPEYNTEQQFVFPLFIEPYQEGVQRADAGGYGPLINPKQPLFDGVSFEGQSHE
jgi:hypothetical protein